MERSGNKKKKEDLFSSLISNIKDYNGNDPLRPWLQGIRKMKETLPAHILKEKLPRFLQKCAQAFESDPRYRNDSRYVRVWIQLMDYVEDAKVVLRKMEKNHIGLKRAMFYSAYALYYEKKQKFEEVENMYRLGVQNLAEPADELHRSHEQFLYRMKLLKERRTEKLMLISSRSNRMPPPQGKSAIAENGRLEKDEASLQISHSTIKSEDQQKSAKRINSISECSKEGGCKSSLSSLDAKIDINSNQNDAGYKLHEDRGNTATDDTVVVKFVGSAIVGKSEAEDACHHGLVDPTVNMKEAMNAIGSMFTEPLELEPMVRRRSHRSKPKESQHAHAPKVFVDLSPAAPKKQAQNEPEKPFVGGFTIWTEEDNDDIDDENYSDEEPKPIVSRTESNNNSSEDVGLKDDTIIRRFMGSTAIDDPRVENACHHGLVDPTVNLKEAMDDINGMFGEPLNFVRTKRSTRNQELPIQQKSAASQGFSVLADDDLEEDYDINGAFGESLNFVRAKISQKQELPIRRKPPVSQGFCILADDDLEEDSKCPASKSYSSIAEDSSLFEPTVFTREAMDEINDMFGKPLDF